MKAVDHFLSLNFEINEQLARLTTHAESHFDVDPDRIHWGHVGDLAEIHAQLKLMLDRIERTGEYAK